MCGSGDHTDDAHGSALLEAGNPTFDSTSFALSSGLLARPQVGQLFSDVALLGQCFESELATL